MTYVRRCAAAVCGVAVLAFTLATARADAIEDINDKIVEAMTVFDDGLVDNLRRELILRSKLSEAISDMATGAYSPLSTQFENSILFLPSACRQRLTSAHRRPRRPPRRAGARG